MIRLGFTEEPSQVSADTMTKEDPQSELLMLRRRVAELETREALSDTSEKETVAEALRVSEEKYRRIFEHAIEGIFQSTPDGRFITVNPAYARMFGYGSPEEMINEVTDIASQLYANPADREEVQQRFEDPVPLTNYEVEWLRKDGTHFWVAINARSVRDESGRMLYYEGMIEDITARKESEEALRNSESLLREAQRVAHIGHWELDSPAGTPKWSEEISHILGLDPSGGAPSFAQMQHILHPDDWDLLNGMIIRGSNQGVPFDIEVRCIRPDRSIRWVNVKGYPTKKRGGESFKMFGTAQDITQRKQAEARIHRQGTLLGAINSILREALESESDADIVRTCLSVAEEITGSRFGFIGEVNKNGFMDTIALSDPGWTECRMLKADLPQLINNMEIRGIWGSVLKSEQSLIINNPASHPDSGGVPDGHTPITSFMGIPLKRSGKTFGLIALANKHGGYEPSDVADMETVSGAFVEALDRQRAERALQVSEDKYRTVVENMQDVFYRTDMEGTITMLSPSAAEMAGYDTVDQMIGLNATKDLYKHPADRDRLLAVLEEKGKVSNFEVELVRRDGDTLIVSTNSHIYYDKSGRPLGIEGVFTDITARKRAENALRESEEKYRILVENANEGIFVAQDGVIKFLNPKMSEMFDYSKEEFISNPITEFVHPDDRERILQSHFRRLAGDQAPTQYPFRLLNKDGQIQWAELVVARITWEGKPAALAFITDITERKAMEEAVKESEEWHRSLVENSFDGIFVQQDRKIIFANSRLYQMLGYSPGELEGMEHWRVYYGEYQQITRERAAARMRGEKMPPQYEVMLQRKDGSFFEGEVSAKVVYVKGRPGVQAWVKDISKKKRTEETQRRLATVVQQASEAVVIMDANNKVQYVNPAFEKITGYSLDDVIAQTPKIWKEAAHDDLLYQRIWETVSSGEVWRGQLTNRRKDGTSYLEDVTVSPVRDTSGQIINYVAIKRDISREVQLQQQLLQSQKMEAIGTLAGGIAHDFNNLLTVVMGYSELLLAEKERDHQEHDDLQTIFHAARNGAELVQRLLMFSRKSEPKPVPMNLNKQVVQVEKLLRRTIPKMIDVKLELSADLPQIDADPSQVEQVIMNLAVNARDSMPDKGKLTLKTDIVTLDEEYCRLHVEASPGEHVVLVVSDTGQGMDKETVEHIFEPFFTTKEMGRGTGLGLAMVYGIIKQHNGHITVYSEVGKGTTFRVYLPAIPADVEPKVEDIGIMPAFGTETVLLVDDEDFVRELGARILTKHGYTVLQAVNGREGLDLFKKERSQISLVVLDLIMPEMGGPECLKELLKIDPKMKILIASGFSADASVKETIQIGAKGFVNKPFRVKEILRDVRRVLDEG
ncbi:MAG: PAS domain S-box protein [Desulfomonilaceae bacterium]